MELPDGKIGLGSQHSRRQGNFERGGKVPWNIRLSAFRQLGLLRPSRRLNSIARSTNRKRRSQSVAISWPSNRSINSHYVYLVSPLRINSPAVGLIGIGKPKISSGNSRIRTSASTTLGFCTNDAQKPSSTLG